MLILSSIQLEHLFVGHVLLRCLIHNHAHHMPHGGAPALHHFAVPLELCGRFRIGTFIVSDEFIAMAEMLNSSN